MENLIAVGVGFILIEVSDNVGTKIIGWVISTTGFLTALQNLLK